MILKECILYESSCYRANRKIVPKGIVVHSTGANNPYLKRYVQPSPANDNPMAIYEDIGVNRYGNHWNTNVDKCVHAMIGYNAAKQVECYQLLPWIWRGWHVGQGKKGSFNNTHISFEMLEDDLRNEHYFNDVTKTAQELCAYLCTLYKLNPMQDGVIVSHHEAAIKGYASNHGDPENWLRIYGKDMNWFREGVKKIMDSTTNKPSDWAKSAWEWGKTMGITDGERPRDTATREEIVTMLYRFNSNL